MKLKILSFNIHKGFNWNNTIPTLEQLKEFLETENPDLVFLQEVVGENKKFDQKFSKYMSHQFEYLSDSLWSDYAYAKNAVYDERHHGNVILSKFPITEFSKINISTNRYEQRGILHCKITAFDKVIQCYNVHLNLTHFGRSKQYRAIKNEIEKTSKSSETIILAGDFNDWNHKASPYFTRELGLNESFQAVQKKYAKTFPALFPLFSLDRIYTRNIKINDAKVRKNNLSDHLPIIIQGELL